YEIRIPADKQLPPVIGRLQSYQIHKGDTLLDVARDSGLGFQEMKDANRTVDEWVPPPDLDVVVPTQRIVPRSRYRGLVLNVPERRLYLFPKSTKPGERVTVHSWAVSIGVDEAQSPLGQFSIRAKDKNPTWGVPDSIYKIMDEPRHVVPPGPDNPLGKYRL